MPKKPFVIHIIEASEVRNHYMEIALLSVFCYIISSIFNDVTPKRSCVLGVYTCNFGVNMDLVT